MVKAQQSISSLYLCQTYILSPVLELLALLTILFIQSNTAVRDTSSVIKFKNHPQNPRSEHSTLCYTET